MLDIKKLKAMEHKSFQGWDFSYINQRTTTEPLPWDYKEIIKTHLKSTDRLLDMGTGGGEFLLTLDHPYHLTYVTESYPPNQELCKGILSPKGIHVTCINEGESLPFDDAFFDIIINRHDTYNIEELHRVLKPGGFFITQQVGDLNNHLLSQKVLGQEHQNPITPTHSITNHITQFNLSGFHILWHDEAINHVKYHDVYTLVYYCKIISWEFPGFGVDKHFDQLSKIDDEIRAHGYVEGQEHRWIMIAQKPMHTY